MLCAECLELQEPAGTPNWWITAKNWGWRMEELYNSIALVTLRILLSHQLLGPSKMTVACFTFAWLCSRLSQASSQSLYIYRPIISFKGSLLFGSLDLYIAPMYPRNSSCHQRSPTHLSWLGSPAHVKTVVRRPS